MRHAYYVRFSVAAGVVAFAVSGGWASAQINEEVNAGNEPYSMSQDFFILPEERTIGSTAGIAP